MKQLSLVAIAVVLAVSIAACGESKEQKMKNEAVEKLTTPYTEKIPRTEYVKPGERLFDEKQAQQKKQ